MRFIHLERADCSLEPSIKVVEEFQKQLRKYLNYIYLFNSPGTELINTYCPKCGELIYKRDFYGPMRAKLKSIKDYDFAKKEICPSCEFKLGSKGTLTEIKY